MRILLLILLIVSTSFTQAAFAMPVMSTAMTLTDMAIVMESDHADHHKEMDETSPQAKHHESKASVSHCICVMCFPAIAVDAVLIQQATKDLLPLPHNGSMLLPDGPEPISPPPRQG